MLEYTVQLSSELLMIYTGGMLFEVIVNCYNPKDNPYLAFLTETCGSGHTER